MEEKNQIPPRDVETRNTMEEVKHTLSFVEINDRAKELSKTLSEAAQLTEQLKEISADFKSQILSLKNTATRIYIEINQGWVMKNVQCVETKDFNLGVAVTQRVDTLEVIRERSLTADELQPRLIKEEEETERILPPPTSAN